jgi:LPS export ABC transporter permease LptG
MIDLYVLGTFCRVLCLAALAGLTVYLIADLTENAEHILRNEVPSEIVIDYYRLKSLDILYEISPIIVLVSTLIGFGLLSRSNEVTACKALGMSLYRLAVPVILMALLVSLFCGLLQIEVLAGSHVRMTELKGTIKGQVLTPLSLRADRRWLYGKTGGYLYNYAHFDEAKEEIHRLQVFKFDDAFRLTDRLMVQRARHLGDGWWQFEDGWARSFEGGTEVGYRVISEAVKEQLPEPPEFFQGAPKRPAEMDFRELQTYIDDLKKIGSKDTAPLEVELHNKVAYPVLSFVMALVALPFAFRLGRQGALYGIGLSIVLGLVLLMFLAVFSAMGENAILPPVVAVWSPGLIFSILSLYLFFGVRT